MMFKSSGRSNRRRSGQVIILTAIIMTIVILSLISLVSQTVNLRQNLRYEPYKEVTEDLAASFRSALAFALANMTAYYNATGDETGGRVAALNYLSKWKEAAMRAYVNLGLQIDFKTPLNYDSAYTLQGPKTISYNGKNESMDAWDLYNLTQLYWDQSSGCSASYAILCINLTEYGFYGWKKDIIVLSNATFYPDTLSGTGGAGGRAPGDIVLVLDSSGSMFWQDLSHLMNPSQDQNDNVMHLTGTISPSSWQTVGTLDVGEIPTEFAAVLDQTSLEFQLTNGSFNEQLIIAYSNATGVYSMTLPAIGDSYVRSKYPNNNYKSDQSLEVSGYRSDIYRAWLKFNLSSIPSEVTIISAQLNLYAMSSYKAAGKNFIVHHSNIDSWTESGITWNNQPSSSSFISTHSATAPTRGWICWDVTSDVQQDYNAHNQYLSLVVMDSSEALISRRYIMVYSREAAGIPGYNILKSSTLPYYPYGKVVWSTSDGSQLSSGDGNFGLTNMWFNGKSGKWMIQLRNPGSVVVDYSIDVYTRKLDQVRNAATTFLKLLNPLLDRVAIVQFGAGSSRSGSYYYASQISGGNDGSPFYELNDTQDFQSALMDINWRDPYSNPKDDIGYGFEWINDYYYQGGYTPLGAGLEVGNRLFNGTQGARDGSQRVLVLITDGKENVKPNPVVPAPPGGPGYFRDPTTYSIDSDLTGDAYSASNVKTYTIGFGMDVDNDSLTELASRGHGAYYYAANGTQLAQILAALAYGMHDELSFHFSLMQEYESGINCIPGSDLTVFITDPVTHQRHKADPNDFVYEGGGNFDVTISFTGSKIPESVDIVIKDPRGILVRLHIPLAYWGT